MLVRVCVVCVVLCCCVFEWLCVVSLKMKWSSTASSGKANDWRNRARVVLDLFSNFKWVTSSVSFGESPCHVITLRGPFFGEQKWR